MVRGIIVGLVIAIFCGLNQVLYSSLLTQGKSHCSTVFYVFIFVPKHCTFVYNQGKSSYLSLTLSPSETPYLSTTAASGGTL